jgi:hypothetical protein
LADEVIETRALDDRSGRVAVAIGLGYDPIAVTVLIVGIGWFQSSP